MGLSLSCRAAGSLASLRERGQQCVSVGRGVRDTVSPLFTVHGAIGTVVEVAWQTAHAAAYPFGLVGDRQTSDRRGYRIDHLPPIQRSLTSLRVETAGMPILLVHGMADNRSVFAVLRAGLHRRGFGQISTMNYSVFTADIRVAAARLADEVDAIVADTGYEQIHVVAHSLGGLIARYYVTRLGGHQHVHTLVTLGTPHGGTYAAYAWNSALTRQLRPGSPLLAELEAPMPGCRTRFVAYWSDLDHLVLPHANGAVTHEDLQVRNVALHGVGHMSIPVMASVVHSVGHDLSVPFASSARVAG